MKSIRMTLALAGALVATAAYANPQPMDQSMAGMAGMQQGAKPAEARGVGAVTAIDAAQGTITLQAQPVASLGWPAMTMTFKVASAQSLNGLKVGAKVRFTFQTSGMAGGVTAIEPIHS